MKSTASAPLPEDLRVAYETFTLLSAKHGFSYAGMMVSIDPPSIIAIGNVKERGHDFAKLLRLYADIMDDKTDAGQIAADQPFSPTSVN
jgi:hypothetical protein